MDLSQIERGPVTVYLSDISRIFSEAEKDLPQEQLATVVVRRAITADNLRRGDRLTEKTVSYVDPGTGILVSEADGHNEEETDALEVFWMIDKVSNLTDEGQPVLSTSPLAAIPLDRFMLEWRSLPAYVSTAIHDAVIFVNPTWG